MRLLAFACLWIVLTEGDVSSAFLAIGAVASAVIADALLNRGRGVGPLSALRAIRVLGRIPLDSVKAGIDVAIRALRPSLPIRPGLVRVPIDVVDPAVRVATAYLTTVLPGTVCVAVEPGGLRLHLIDRRRDVGAQVAQVAQDMERALRGGRHG
ncbi:MAG: Na+/H+ antiporter subunit E [Alphaproteobacteria bacterium]|nr:Na+/H+ antiporter subunit E [Alphaproteobacteria bacterium]